ncbi:MAG: hydrogenase maturation nickel metallochaperone HypA [Pseudomonadota bacterium]
MHEMSLCEGIVQIIEEQAGIQQYSRVRTVWLEIGPLACVEPEALRFSFEVVSRNTLAEGAVLEIIRTAGRAWCARCRKSVPVSQLYDACPECGGYELEITGGEETRIKELEVE